jgi:hypothetical protein
LANCYVSEFRGAPQLSTGKFGKITVVEKGSGSEELSETEDAGKGVKDSDSESSEEDF